MSPAASKEARRIRREPTDAEAALWGALSVFRPRFTRQLRVRPYTLDFACRSARVAVEVDGGQHSAARDARRDRALEAKGWRVLHLWNNDVLGNIEGAVFAVAEIVGERVPVGTFVGFVESRAGRERRPRTRQPKVEKG